jgi:hypothetical protein
MPGHRFPLPRQLVNPQLFRARLTRTDPLLQGWQFERQFRFGAQKSSNSVNEGEAEIFYKLPVNGERSSENPPNLAIFAVF